MDFEIRQPKNAVRKSKHNNSAVEVVVGSDADAEAVDGGGNGGLF